MRIICGFENSTTNGNTMDWKAMSTIDWEQVSYECFIAEGSFGQIHTAMVMNDGTMATAKQTTKNLEDPETSDAMINELKQLKALNHPNLVNYVGISASSSEKVCLLMEHTYGKDLLTHIHQVKNDQTRTQQAVPHLIRILLRIGEGVEYLSGQGIVHSDIQARNIFLTTHQLSTASPKLGTAGMVQATHPENYALVNGKDVPIRWAAPEVLAEFFEDQISMDHHESVFNLDLNFGLTTTRKELTRSLTKPEKGLIGDSDTDTECSGSLEEEWSGMDLCRESRQNAKTMIWSYGVLLFECLSLGQVPYGVMDDEAVKRAVLMDKYQLKAPKTHTFPSMIEKLMNGCLQFEPKSRPGFDSILRNLRTIGIHKQEVEKKMLIRSLSNGNLKSKPNWYHSPSQFKITA